MPLAYRMKDFAQLTGLSLSTVKREVYAGKLKAIKKRGNVLITAEAAREYLELFDDPEIKNEAQPQDETLQENA
jgi:excisionase family DNA binding protein